MTPVRRGIDSDVWAAVISDPGTIAAAIIQNAAALTSAGHFDVLEAGRVPLRGRTRDCRGRRPRCLRPLRSVCARCDLLRGSRLDDSAGLVGSQCGEDDAALDLCARDGDFAVEALQGFVPSRRPSTGAVLAVGDRRSHLGERVEDSTHGSLAERLRLRRSRCGRGVRRRTPLSRRIEVPLLPQSSSVGGRVERGSGPGLRTIEAVAGSPRIRRPIDAGRPWSSGSRRCRAGR